MYAICNIHKFAGFGVCPGCEGSPWQPPTMLEKFKWYASHTRVIEFSRSVITDGLAEVEIKFADGTHMQIRWVEYSTADEIFEICERNCV